MLLKLFYLNITFFLLLLISSCSYYAPQRYTVETSTHSPNQCLFNENQTAIDSRSIKIISWNSLAGCHQMMRNLAALTFCSEAQANQSLLELTKNRDILIIQEAFMDSEMRQTLKNLGTQYSWDMGISYILDQKKDIPTGVYTVANAQALSACSQRSNDVLLPTPKAILFTTYNLSDGELTTNEKLLVVNVHAILISQSSLYAQLDRMAKKMSRHEGPIILAGDFNTMTENSYLKLKEIVGAIGMVEATMEKKDDHRVTSMLGQAYDFIFYKKLRLIRANSIDLAETRIGKTSDHNPIFAEFQGINVKP